MASLDVIRTLTIRAKAEGFGATQAAVTDLGQAYDSSARRQLSMDRSLEQLERRFVQGAREAQEFAKVQRQIALVTAQNPALQDRANRVLEEAGRQFRVANDNTVKYTRNNQLARFELINLSRQIQDVGVGLASGQAAMTVAIQQGTQIADVFASAGVSMGAFARQVIGMITPMRLLIGITGLLAAGGVLLASSWKDAALQFLALSERLDTPIARLRELQAVTATFGIDQPEMFRGFEGLSDRLGEARRETGELFKLFEANNATVGNLEETLFKVADLVQNAANGADRYRITQMAGLPPTAEWVRLLSQGGDALRQMASDAGQFTDALDPLSRKAREFDEAWNTAWANFSLRARSAITDAIGALSSLISSAQDFLTRQMLRFRTEAELGRQALGAGLGTQLTTQQAESFYQLTGALRATDAAGKTVIPTMERVGRTVKDAGKEALSALDVLRNNVNALGDAATASEKYELAVAELVAKLQEGTISQETFNRAVASLNPTTKAIEGTITDLGEAISKAFIEGKNASDAFASSLKAIAATNISNVIKGLTKGLTGQGFDLTSILTGGLIGIGASLLSRLFGGGDNKAEQEAQAKAAEAAKKALQEANATLETFTTKVIALNVAARQTPLQRLSEAQQNYNLALDAAQRVANLAAILGGTSIDAAEAAAAVADATAQLLAAGRALSSFYVSESERLLNMLQGTEEETGLAKQLRDFGEAAEALQFILVQLGDSAETAAEFVDRNLVAALNRIKETFTSDLARRLNEALGKGFINQISDLIAEIEQMRRDAATLGVADTGTIGQIFAAEAQKIIDSAQLTGEAFDDLIKRFPVLVGKVHEFENAVADAGEVLARTADELASAVQALEDRWIAATPTLLEPGGFHGGALFQFDRLAQREREEEIRRGGENIVLLERVLAAERLQIMEDIADRARDLTDRLAAANEDATTLEGQLAAFDRQAARERLEEVRRGGDNLLLLESTLSAERARIIRDFNEQAIAAEQERVDAMNAAAKSIVDYVNSLFATELGGLSPRNQLAQAQATYQATLAKAREGDLDAVNRLADDAENFRKALRAMFGSTEAYQTGLRQIATDLLGLPTVQDSTDRIVNAIRDSIIVLQRINVQLGGSYIPTVTTPTNVIPFPEVNEKSGSFAVTQQLQALRRENAMMLGQIAALVQQGNNDNVEAIEAQERAITSETRMQSERLQARK